MIVLNQGFRLHIIQFIEDDVLHEAQRRNQYILPLQIHLEK